MSAYLEAPSPPRFRRASDARTQRDPTFQYRSPHVTSSDRSGSHHHSRDQAFIAWAAASSLLDAAAQAMKAWSRLWWWDPDLSLDVTCGDRYWKVGSRWVRASLARRKRGGDGASR